MEQSNIDKSNVLRRNKRVLNNQRGLSTHNRDPQTHICAYKISIKFAMFNRQFILQQCLFVFPVFFLRRHVLHARATYRVKTNPLFLDGQSNRAKADNILTRFTWDVTDGIKAIDRTDVSAKTLCFVRGVEMWVIHRLSRDTRFCKDNEPSLQGVDTFSTNTRFTWRETCRVKEYREFHDGQPIRAK